MIIGQDDPDFRVLVPLSFRMFGLACRLAVESRNEGDRPDVSAPAGAVVLSVAALEAFVNEQADADREAVNEAKQAGIDAALKERELPDRWDALVRAIGRGQFRRGERPFQSFERLHELRNAIVHYRPYFLVPGALPDGKRGRILADLRSEYAFRDDPQVAPWTHRLLSPGCAAWACRTARDMIRFHLDQTGQPARWGERVAALFPLPPELEATAAKP